MKKGALFSVLFFCISFALAFPEIVLQHEDNQIQETVFGLINNSLTELTRDNFKIFEGRKEVFFERDVLKYNNTYYFYVIFSKSGEFNLSFGNVLYNDAGNINSIMLEREISIIEPAENESKILSIKPGFYYGSNPELVLSNMGATPIEVKYEKEAIVLNQYELKSVKINAQGGFSFFQINSYKNFLVPIIYLDLNLNSNSTSNETQDDITGVQEENNINISIQKNITMQLVISQPKTYFVKIKNFGDKINITAKSDIENLKFEKNIFLEANSTTDFEILTTPQAIGASINKIEFYYLNKKIHETEVQIFVFEDENSENIFEEKLNSDVFRDLDCSDGFICKTEEVCDSSEFSLVSGEICCPIRCNSKKSSEVDFSQILVGLAIIGIVVYMGYYFYKKSKKTSSINVKDKFKELDLKYQKKISGKT